MANFDYAARLTEVGLVGILAQRFGGRIEWDKDKGVTNRKDLNACIREPARKGWDFGGDV